MNFYNVLLVGAGGFIGSMARYIVVYSVDKRMSTSFPYGTLAVNIIGSFVLGVIVAISWKKTGADHWKLFLGTGFCGGFTTFSAFAMENLNLFEQRLGTISILYAAGSLIFGFLAVWAGFALGKGIS